MEIRISSKHEITPRDLLTPPKWREVMTFIPNFYVIRLRKNYE